MLHMQSAILTNAAFIFYGCARRFALFSMKFVSAEVHSGSSLCCNHSAGTFSQVLCFTVTLSEFQIAWVWTIRADIMTIL
jgi:hypothetical protein